ncbi:MAG: hypothetical protein R3F33_17025 [Planctomycetota bacterium]
MMSRFLRRLALVCPPLLASCALNLSSESAAPAESTQSVSPGLVAWQDLEAAREASRISGKPVLQLDMFGRLDEALC